MQYTTLFFLSASVLMISNIISADMPNMPYEKKDSVKVPYRGRNLIIKYSPQEPGREFISDFKKQAGIPNEVNIKILVRGNILDENRLIGSYQGSDSFGNQPPLRVLVPLSSLE